MRKNILTTAALLVVLAGVSFAQTLPQFSIPITIEDGNSTFSNTLNLGVSGDGAGGSVTDNTVGGDVGAAFGAYEESQLPPTPPPPYDFDVRFTTLPGRVSTWPTGLGTGLGSDYRGYTSTSQIDSFRVSCTGDAVASNGVIVSWPSTITNAASSWTIQQLGGAASANMTTQSSLTIPSTFGPIQFLIIVTNYNAPASPGPTFSPSDNPLDFGNVTSLNTVTKTLTITNPGTSNDLEITAIGTPTDAAYTVTSSPTLPATVPANGGSITVDIEFTAPGVGGPVNATIDFTHNDPTAGTVSTINLTATVAAANQNELAFSADEVAVNDNTIGLTESLSIGNFDASSAGGDLAALQVFVISNAGGLSLTGVSRGSEVSNPAEWGFSYTIANGPVNADLSSNDTIKVVLWGLTQSLTTGLYPGSLIDFTYRSTDISADSVTANLHIAALVASNADGDALTITPDADQVVKIFNQAGITKGDANSDGTINILDILEVIDHILGVDPLVSPDFERADIAPWNNVTPSLSGDGAVNAQDLALIQKVITDGQYPNGTLLSLTGGSLSKAEGNVELLYSVDNGIVTVSVNSEAAIKGLQFDIKGAALAGTINSSFGDAHTGYVDGALRTVIYDVEGSVIPAGQTVIAEIPVEGFNFAFANVTVADENNNALNVKVTKQGLGSTPAEFALGSNYPNPFNPSTSFSVNVPYTSNVTIEVYNSLGMKVRTLVNGTMEAGNNVVTWNGMDDNGNAVSSGVYVYRMAADGFSATRTMLLSK